MNRIKKCNYNRIIYVAQKPVDQQDGEGLFDIFKSTGKQITSIATSKFSKEVAKNAATAGVENFALSAAEALGKSAAEKVINKLSAPSIVKENKPAPNSGTKIVDRLKKVDSLPLTVQASEIDALKQHFDTIYVKMILIYYHFFLKNIFI